MQRVKKKNGFFQEIKKHGFLYGMTVPGILQIFIFSYIPMLGLVIAFQNFNVKDGIFGSSFCGLNNFRFFFNGSIWPGLSKAAVNTLWLNVIFIIASTFVSVVLAVVFSEITAKKYKKITQTLSLLPYFISWTIVSLFLNNAVISTDNGILTNLLEGMGIQINFYQEAWVWPIIMVVLKVWQASGYGAIVYLATITGIDPGIMEAAEIDGATKWQKIRYMTLPILRPTVILMTLFNIGRIFYGDFGMFYALIGDNSMLYSTVDVIDTYTYRAMRTLNEYGLSTAIGMVQSVLGFIMVVTANKLARKYEPDSAIF
ncbi:ABC transporter, permease protein [Marvinbryantia formatexigens DSM 14469]|uniref:ABC transporter, permease protein n=1 Tax=Marvinbryantia formatexigens DSM 14469 TaxID=478749 RepID=C6LJA5_9FIRM|nr:ABC transporter permease subunit [Marvinbryantia formatexigens]EET59219.1 ABC transporter, permease protein [Marvinbryantia formatexigens DSM 14469]UWO25446.1 ABC transporter permease subunit [Marvinbryantia formatexigens DSM 14469]SDG75489.1 putative aldouronate transport system permease protein [Marvinbryantia formatexigens]